MEDGSYEAALERWGLQDEGLDDSRTVTDAQQMRDALSAS